VAQLTQSISQLSLPPSQEEAKKRDGSISGSDGMSGLILMQYS